MKVTFHTFTDAIKHQWKSMLVVTLIFALLGAGCGWYYGEQQAHPAQGMAQVLASVDLSKEVYDVNYYVTCRNALNTAYSNLVQYLKALSAEPTLSTEQKTSLQEFQLELSQFETEILASIRNRLGARNALYFPEEFLNERIEYYENLIATNQDNLLQAETAADIIKNMAVPELTDADILKSYKSLLSVASNYGNYKVNEVRFAEIKEQLSHESGKIIADGRKMFRDLEAAEKQLNGLIEEVSLAANTIAEENHFNLTLTYDDKDAVTPSIVHTHRENDPQEIFQLLTLFCTLVGICSGGFFAVCRQAKREKKEEEAKCQTTSVDKAESTT